MTRLVFVLLLALLPLPFASAAPAVPPDLQPWQDWALHGAESTRCPFFAGDAQQRRCAWPGRLELAVDGGGAGFAVDVQAYADSWFALPGDAESWPQDVVDGGRSLPVVLRGGVPQVKLAAGGHAVRGTLRWERRPESLALGAASAWVQLELDGAQRQPLVDEAGRLWFGRVQPAAAAAAGERNTVVARVYRRLADGVPPMLTTRVELDIAGEDREILLGRALPEGFAPVSLAGALPARLEKDGNLRVQARAGRWFVTLEARQVPASVAYRTEPREGAWPAQELWVFATDHRLRTVTLAGAPSVDPRQTGLPEDWQALPAFVVAGDAALTLKEQVRGDANPQPEPLVLRREFWLDFDGGGLTARDRLTGELERSGRLAFAPGVQPGRVTLNGEPQVITTLAGEQAAPGIEVRPGPLNVEAVSRMPLAGAIPANGWARDVHELSATLQLPPGWTLFAATGVDRAQPAWISGWTLWDIFLVLVLTVATARLADWRVAVLMLATLLVTQDVNGAPLFLWLNLVAVLAVWKVLPDGRMRQAVNTYRYLSVAMLAVVALLFAVDQVRQGLYPELEYPWRDIHAPVAPEPMVASAPAAEADVFAEGGAPDMQALEETKEIRAGASEPVRRRLDMLKGKAVSAASSRDYAQVDPGARVQTGPGVPDWRWNAVGLHWDGPVAQAQQVDLWLVGPGTNRVLCFLRVLLVAVLVLALWLGRLPVPRLPARAVASSLSLLVLVLAGALGVMAPGQAVAALPDSGLLAELRSRLTAAPDCLPSCAAIAALRVEAGGDRVALRLRVDAVHRVAVPLPAEGSGWRPRSVLLDGHAAPLLAHEGGLVVAVEPGVHDVLIEGVAADAMSFAFPLSPGRVTVAAAGWQVGGVVDGRLAGGSLELKRSAGPVPAVAQEKKLLAEPEPPFVIVERTLRFDIDWLVETRVLRVAPSDAPLALEIPLLAGETVTSRVNVKDGRVLVSLAQGQADTGWSSVLKPVSQLVLVAGKDSPWVERWLLDATTRWHVAASGVPPVKGAGGTAWHPWPGEQLALAVTRPQPAAGDTLTLERVRLEHTPGHRVANSVLALTLLSSEGGDWRFPLPAGATLERIEIDGVPQVLAGDGREAVVPLHPGEQGVVVGWRSDNDTGLQVSTPALQLGKPLANIDIVMNVPRERWPLFAGGPGAGPAVLYWGVLLVVVAVALVLARVPHSPLRAHEWLLLGIGMSSTMLAWTLVVVAWFFVLVARGRADPSRWKQPGLFNFTQLMLALFTLLALGVLFSAVPQSLVLGNPDMQIQGNGSNAAMLHWFVDRVADAGGTIGQGWLVSLPMWAYRLLMLAWSLWLALALVRWLKWGWQQYSAGGLWLSEPKVLAGDRAYVDEGGAAAVPAAPPVPQDEQKPD